MSELTHLPPPSSGYSFPGVSNLHSDIYPTINAINNPALSQPGKVILITGAGRGIGRAITLQYAHASVSAIFICARTSSQLDEVEQSIKSINQDIKVQKFEVDVRDEEQVKKCADAVRSSEGRLDVLVNNAGGSAPWVPIADSKPSEWWSGVELNLKGPYLFIQAFLPLLTETAKKYDTIVDIVNMSSIGANLVVPTTSSYQVSKLALSRLTEFVHAEYAGQGVNVVALHPGGVKTSLTEQEASLEPFCIDTPELAGGFTVWLTKGARTWLGGRYVAATWDAEVLEGLKDDIVKEDKLKTRLVV